MNEDVLARLPGEIRLAGWMGPTLFTLETRHGHLATLETFSTALAGHAHAASMVIGSVRETQGSAATPYAAFCVEPTKGNVVLVELVMPYRVRFVNSGLRELAASLDTFVSAWAILATANDATAHAARAEVRAQLAAIDVAAMSDVDAFWPTLLETHS